MDWFDVILYALFSTTIAYLVYRNFKIKVLVKSISHLYLEQLAEKSLLEKEIEKLYQEQKNKELEKTDGFLKFVSDSRDWAFEYIEEVQKALTEFDEEVAPRLEWANTYGRVAGNTIHTETITKISEAYNKLKLVLPKDNQTPNN
jgi:hypothetical protein